MYAFRCSDAGEGEDLEEWSLPTLLTFELAWSPEVVRRGSVGVMKKVLTVQFSARHANLYPVLKPLCAETAIKPLCQQFR